LSNGVVDERRCRPDEGLGHGTLHDQSANSLGRECREAKRVGADVSTLGQIKSRLVGDPLVGPDLQSVVNVAGVKLVHKQPTERDCCQQLLKVRRVVPPVCFVVYFFLGGGGGEVRTEFPGKGERALTLQNPNPTCQAQ